MVEDQKNLKEDVIETIAQWPMVSPLVILCQQKIVMERIDTEGMPEMFLMPPDPKQVIAMEAARREREARKQGNVRKRKQENVKERKKK